jgi:pyrroline-5-carboxylate reductase
MELHVLARLLYVGVKKLFNYYDYNKTLSVNRIHSKEALVAGQCGYFSVMCLGEMTTQNDENCLRKLFSAIGKV